MKLIFVTEARFTKDKNGNVYGDTSFNKNLWSRYLAVFSHIYIMARVKYDEKFIGKESNLSSVEKVTFIELPYFVGPIQYLKVKRKLKKKIKENIETLEAKYLCRVPGNISNLVIKNLINKNIPYGVEVVGDPWEVFAPGTIKHPLRIYFRWKGYLDLKYNIKNANAVLYVTIGALQKRYPFRKDVFNTNASNVKIKDEFIANLPKKHFNKEEYKLLSIGSLEQMYKSPDVVIKTIKRLNDNGVNCNLTWLGDGFFKAQMELLCKKLEISHKVEFKGNVSADEVRKYLTESDVFVLASRTEGLPRAIIEAMSIGLPCVGTNVGGIPELISKDVLVPKNDEKALFKVIKKTLSEPDFYNEQAKINLQNVHLYKESVLTQKRNQFYKFLSNLDN
jgi:glycosyltransferase involved in cell wall biosynthesis